MRVGNHLGERLLQGFLDFDPTVSKVVGAQQQGPPDQVVDLHGLALRRHLARKTQQVLDNLLGPLSLVDDDLELAARGLRHPRLLHQQIGEAQDGGQRIVDLVGNSGNQLADRSHLFRLHQLRLQQQFIGDIAHHHDDRVDVAQMVTHGAQVGRKVRRTVFPRHQRQLQVIDLQAE